MASLGQAKTLGGIGAILALLFWVPSNVGIGLLIVGLVLMLIAVKNIADTVGDQAIFSNMMYSVIHRDRGRGRIVDLHSDLDGFRQEEL